MDRLNKHADARGRRRTLSGPEKCRRKFLEAFPEGFTDETYLDWERNYKWTAHKDWLEALDLKKFAALLDQSAFIEIAQKAVAVEGRTHLIFSYEKMALRDAVRSPQGAQAFSEGLFQFLYGGGALKQRFEAWRDVVAGLPRKQSRVLTWPILTVFGFLAQPRKHIYLKPTVMRRAAVAYGYDFQYSSKPSWVTYESVLGFADKVFDDLADMHPRDMIDVQSFLWVQGSDEY